MKLKMEGLSGIAICFLIAIITTISVVIKNPSAMFVLCMLVFTLTFIEILKNYKKNICIVCFYISIFTFLIGGELLQKLGLAEKTYSFAENIECHAYFSILLSISVLFIAYTLSSALLNEGYLTTIHIDDGLITPVSSYRKVSLFLFYSLSIFKVITLVPAIIFTATFGYSNYYIEYSFNGPDFLLKLANMSTVCFFVYLATMPTKKEVKIPLLLYLMLSGLTLFIGYRNEFVVNVLFIIIYIINRDLISPTGEYWVKKKHIIVLIISVPIMLSILYGISRMRIHIDNENGFDLFAGVIDFFNQQGFSINIIKWERELHDNMPLKLYSIGQTIDFFTSGNVFSKLLFSIEAYSGQTVERALNGNQLSYYLTYIKFPWDYSMGYGVGSSFIAEAFHDLGYFGIALFSSIYGIVMSQYKRFFNKNVWVTACFYIAITELLMAPRGYSDSFFAQILNLTNLEVFLIIYLTARLLSKR